MKIKKYPEATIVELRDIVKGNCFSLTDECFDWDEGEIFMLCDDVPIGTEGSMRVVHLETGCIDKFYQEIFVQRVNAHIVCE